MVYNYKDYINRVEFIFNRFKSDALVEEFIAGRDIYVSILGDKKIILGSPLVLCFSNNWNARNKFATYRVKWDENYENDGRFILADMHYMTQVRY